jgi:hypothetical protein
MLILIVSGMINNAFSAASSANAIGEGIPIEIIESASTSTPSKTSSIQATIDGHTLSVVFLENLGQVTIDVSLVGGGEVETQSTPTPNGVIIYIPDTGSYIVTFTLSNGDAYYGEFEVTD